MLVGGRNGLGRGVLRIALLNTTRWLEGHPVLVAVVPPAAIRAVTALFRVSVPAASVFFDVMPCVVSTLIVDGENKSGLSALRWRLLMD